MPDPLLSISDLRIDFGGSRPAVRGIDLTLDRGEVLALVGESGSGKSMTARAVLGLLPPGARAEGSIVLDGQEVLGLPDEELRHLRGRVVAMVFQEPQTALNPVRTVGWQIGEALRAHGGISRAAARRRAIDLLRQVEIPDPEQRVDHFAHQLSGGQKQRVVLALALANDPAVLLADEPTTALDVTVQAEILALLGRVRARTGVAVLLITHNLGVAAQVADAVTVLRDGLVVESGPAARVFADPRDPYTQRLLAAVPRLPERTPAPVVSDRTEDVRPALAASRGAERPTAGAGDTVVPVAALNQVRVLYRGKRGRPDFTAVRGVSLEVRPGEVVGMVGESGSGKTTLGRVLAGLITPTSGTVQFLGENLSAVPTKRLRELRRGLAMVHQDPAASLDPRLTVGESIREPLDIQGIGTSASRRERVAKLLEAVRLPTSTGLRRARELSGGQRQRVTLARALALAPRLLIADEPTSALDVSVQADVLELFRSLQSEWGFACVFISHDLAVIHEVCGRVVVLHDGSVVESGPVTEVFATPRNDYSRRLLDAVPRPVPGTGADVA